MHDVPLAPAANGLVLRGQGYRTSIGLIGNTLFWMVAALSALTVWMLLGTWRHMRRRVQIQSALVQETNFRRAMENSMLTGMRAMDLEGRITYVNPAFCAMTGFSETELIGRLPPFPYWPPDRVDENARLLQQELQGRSPAGGIEVKVMRKDGSLFDARMYVSPLIDPKGQQTGWMTSMTNITEAKRIRDQLSASHERFTTVLEGLDAAVSVLSVQQGELLFANRSYRLWFGADARGHALLAGGDAGAAATRPTATTRSTACRACRRRSSPSRLRPARGVRRVAAEVVRRALALPAVDRRPAGADADRHRHHRAAAAPRSRPRSQAEKAQVTSRLVTMGEMASSVAHELNQPLTAITNYCNGMVSRVRGDSIGKDDLIAALQKTSRQAERAGQIIHRIRAFVKRSEPQRQARAGATIVDDAVDLAGIELRRRNVAIHTYVAQRLPTLMVDPILIEQVRAQPAEERRRGDRQRAAAAGAAPHRAARGAAPHRRRRRRHRVQRHRHGPGPEGRGDRAACTRRSSRPRSTAWASACRCAARSSSPTGAGSGRRTSTMARPPSAVDSPSRCRSNHRHAARSHAAPLADPSRVTP